MRAACVVYAPGSRRIVMPTVSPAAIARKADARKADIAATWQESC
jgi:hypothetical protein